MRLVDLAAQLPARGDLHVQNFNATTDAPWHRIVMQTIPDVMDDVLVDIFVQRYQKLELLCQQLFIDEGTDQELGPRFWLAFRLACRHVPGFRIMRVPPRKVGRLPTIDDPLKGQLRRAKSLKT
jgi:hypothetical protein